MARPQGLHSSESRPESRNKPRDLDIDELELLRGNLQAESLFRICDTFGRAMRSHSPRMAMNLEAQAIRSRIIRDPVLHSTCQSVCGPAQCQANVSEAS